MRTALAIAAHPDDIEFLMSGTLMLLKDAGFAIHYMNLANGCCGSTEYDADEIARIRRDEARAAATRVSAMTSASSTTNRHWPKLRRWFAAWLPRSC